MACNTEVINIRQNSRYDIYIGRGSKFGNKYSHIYKKGIIYCPTREIAIERFEADFRKNPNMIELLKELKGKTLGCFCKPKSCHGDIYIKLIKEFNI